MNNLIVLILSIGLSILIFLICREIVTWYFKLNRIVSLLEEINAKLPNLPQSNVQDAVPATALTPLSHSQKQAQQSGDEHFEQPAQYRKNPLTNR